MNANPGDRLRAAGMDGTAAANKVALFNRAARALDTHGVDTTRADLFYVPGRIEVLGKHTDYAGGRSLLCTAERGVCLVATPRPDSQVHVVDVGWRSETAFDLAPDLAPRAGHWSNYPMTVARRIARNFPGARFGCDIAFVSDLPAAAGMSSSSMLLVAIFLALAEANELASSRAWQQNIATREDLAGYLATVENGDSFRGLAGDRGVGTFGGSEDHTAILCCRAGELAQFGFCPVVDERRIPFPAAYRFVVAASGVPAEKTGEARDAYNRASAGAQAILEAWHVETGRDDSSLAAAARSAPDAPDRLRGLVRRLAPAGEGRVDLGSRLEQFLEESEAIVPAVGDALARGDVEAIGPLVDRSQANAERLLGNQVPETVFLARSARDLGAVAASSFGAGFGGSVWAIVPSDQAETFERMWRDAYGERFPPAAARGGFFSTVPGPAALRLAD